MTDVCLIGRGWPCGGPRFFFSSASPKNTLGSRATAPADIEPLKGLGWGRSVPTRKTEIDEHASVTKFVASQSCIEGESNGGGQNLGRAEHDTHLVSGVVSKRKVERRLKNVGFAGRHLS